MCSVHRANFAESKITQMERMTESGVPDTSESSSKLYLASFPGENPTELEFTTWLNGARDRLRVARLLKYAVSAAPAAPADLAAKNLIPAPDASVADAIKQSVMAKNLQIAADNADRAAAWADRVRDKSDLIAGALQLSLRPMAPGRLKALELAHVRSPPNEHQLDGGAMFRALLTLGGTLDSEGEAKRALAQVAYMRANILPDNSTTNQFDARVNEFDTHINPALEMRYTGENYVKLLLDSCIPACLETDGRLLRRELESSFITGTSGPTRMTCDAEPDCAGFHLNKNKRLYQFKTAIDKLTTGRNFTTWTKQA